MEPSCSGSARISNKNDETRPFAVLTAALAVLIDLSQVKFLTSAGIVALFSERAFGRPALFCPDGSVSAKLLAIVQAQRLVPIYRDLDAALKGLGAAA